MAGTKVTTKEHRVLRIVLFLVAGVIVVAIAFYAWLVIGLSGGFHQWLLGNKHAPDFKSASFQRLRDATDSQFDTMFSDNLSGFTQYAVSSSDACDKGQHNYEVQDAYAYICSRMQTRYYGFDGDFKTTMLAFDRTLKVHGWKSDNVESIPWVLSDYYDVFYVQQHRAGYTLSSLPGATYDKDGVGMEIGWAQRGDSDLLLFENQLNQVYGTQYSQKQPIDGATVAAQIFSKQPIAMSISLSKDYYQH